VGARKDKGESSLAHDSIGTSLTSVSASSLKRHVLQQKFVRGLKQLEDHAVTEQVYSFRDIEEEAYTICRWLRATKFDATKILQRLSENQDMFHQAKVNEFYPNIEKALGAPVPVFLSQYPFLAIGRGKNGCPVNFFLAGKINPEGILCVTTIERIQCYFWYTFMWKFKNEIRLAKEADPDFVRVEGINVLDLTGLNSSAMTSETMEVIKLASKISDFFPEVSERKHWGGFLKLEIIPVCYNAFSTEFGSLDY
jgi:hypothetical protein